MDILSPKEGYDKIADQYKKYHTRLNWDKGMYQRFLHRDLSNKKILDLGAGDARLADFFRDKGIDQYVACDISKRLLANAPGWVDKKVCDLEKVFEFDSKFDVILSFFVLNHIKDLDFFFQQVNSVLNDNGRFIILHNKEKKEFCHKVDDYEFKIKTYKYSFTKIESKLKQLNAKFFEKEIVENGSIIGKIYCLLKS